MNAHGHLHQAQVRGFTRHVNVSVEQLDYRPVLLDDIRCLAKALIRGRLIPGRTTRQQLEHLERKI